AGRSVLLASPKHAQLFLQSLQSRAKTDRLDSRGLALYALAHSLSEYPTKSALVEELCQLLSLRKSLSLTISRFQIQKEALPTVSSRLEKLIASLTLERKEIDEQIKQLTADKEAFPQVAALQQVPGIGPVTAATVASRLSGRT